MCELRQNGKYPVIHCNELMPGLVYTVSESGEVNQTRWAMYKLLCKHKGAEWEDAPEVGDNETIYLEEGTELMVVRS